MAAIVGSNFRAVEQFDISGDAWSVSTRWKAWLDEFECFADSQPNLGTDTDARKKSCRASLKWHLGPAAREIFKNLPEIGEDKEYDEAVAALNLHFVVPSNTTFMRSLFRGHHQKPDETIAQYVSRLRKAADGCDFGIDRDNQIRDQVVASMNSGQLRKKFLTKGGDLTLQELQKTAGVFESVESQASQLESVKLSSDPVVNRVSHYQGTRPKECHRCGSTRHLANDSKCPALGKQCNKCGKENHFASKCTQSEGRGISQPQPHHTHGKRHHHRRARGRGRGSVNAAAAAAPEQEAGLPRPGYSGDSEQGYNFHVDRNGRAFRMSAQRLKDWTLPFTVGGVQIDMIPDSACTDNIISKSTWEEVQAKGITYKPAPPTEPLYAYVSEESIEEVLHFMCDISINNTTVSDVVFKVIAKDGEPLLSKDVSEALGILKVGIGASNMPKHHVRAVRSLDILRDYKDVFTGIGKLKDRQIQLTIDPTVKPVAQTRRHTAFGLRAKVEEQVKKLLEQDIIEPVTEPSAWVSPTVPVPKANGEVRLCVDMRRANEAIVRKRHPIPTFEESLQDMSESRVFSKLDFISGYHQMELHPDSREITTFIVHNVLYRYKRLNFGINSGPENYQEEIDRVLAGVQNVANISDDIVVHGKDDEQHDKALREVLDRIRQSGMTLNKEKCKFGMDKITFWAHDLSADGIDLAQSKVKAIAEACEPTCESEVRSFLGLAEFCSAYIPYFASIADPLYKLLHKGQQFIFGKEQQDAFK